MIYFDGLVLAHNQKKIKPESSPMKKNTQKKNFISEVNKFLTKEENKLEMKMILTQAQMFVFYIKLYLCVDNLHLGSWFGAHAAL